MTNSPRKPKKQAKLPEKLEAQLRKAAAIAREIVPTLVTHSTKLSAATALVITPVAAFPDEFPGSDQLVGEHLLTLADKLDCVTNSIYVPVRNLARHYLGGAS